MKKKTLVFMLALVLISGSIAFAQIMPEGKITGKVVDDQGNPLPGVTVEATSPRLVGKAATVTDATGTFRLMALPSGTYQLTFSLPGFKTLVRKDIVLQLSQTLVLNVTIEPAAIEEQVTVVGQSPLVDVKSTVKGQVMTKEVFMSLPRGRTFDTLISTMPGVTSEGITGGLSVDGATGTENMWYIDGANITNIHLGTRGQNVVLELVDEVKVTASGYNAEFGGSMGGVVNVISRSGGNTFHGDIMGYYNNNKLWMQGKDRQYLRQNPYVYGQYEYVSDDDLYFDGGKKRDKYNRLEGIVSFGGYILKDKLWFFASFDPIYIETKALRDFNQRQGPWSEFKQTNNYYNGSIKLTAAPARGLRVSLSYVNNFYTYKGTIPSVNGTDNPNTDYANYGYDYPNWNAAYSIDYTASNNLLLSLRGGYHLQNQTNPGVKAPDHSMHYFSSGNSNYSKYLNDPYYIANPTLLHYTGWSNYSTAWDYKKRLYDNFSTNFDVTYYANFAGEHAFKAGVQWIYLHENVDQIIPHPLVNLYFGRTYNGLGFPVGAGAPEFLDDGVTPNPYYGYYGYYMVRSSFTSVYGYQWNVHSNNWALYIQDSWTIGNRLTINYGLRTESEYVPSFATNNPQLANIKPIKFSFGDKLAPRIGAVYDVFGDSSLKIFAHFGIYYDVMKLYMAEGAFGGFKWITDYYALQDPDWTKIAASGLIDDFASQQNGNTYAGSINYREVSFDTVDPNLKPVSQRNLSFGIEKKLSEDLSLSLRFVQNHLIRTIEDIGVYVRNPETGMNREIYYIANPGYGYTKPASEGGKFSDLLTIVTPDPDWVADPAAWAAAHPGENPINLNYYWYWPEPKARREYYGLNVSLEKRFSHHWQGGINYTLSRVEGNYGGLSSPDESGRNSPNVERYFDYWFMHYKVDGRPLDGPLPQDRTHYIKAYGSYAFPFGLTVGLIAYCRSGLPRSSYLNINNTYMYPYGYGDLGRLPWAAWADLYLEYTLRFAHRYSFSINAQINNVTNTKSITGKSNTLNRVSIWADDVEFLDGTLVQDLQNRIDASDPGYPASPAFNMWTSRMDAWSARLGFKFSF